MRRSVDGESEQGSTDRKPDAPPGASLHPRRHGRGRLAVNRNYTTQGGEKRDEVCFLTIVVWGKQAESCGEYLDKGSQIFVEGRLQTRDWEGKDGQKRSVTEVVAERVQFMGRTKGAPSPAPAAAPFADEAPAEDDVPF